MPGLYSRRDVLANELDATARAVTGQCGTEVTYALRLKFERGRGHHGRLTARTLDGGSLASRKQAPLHLPNRFHLTEYAM
eukprot:scaffold159502_cov33-Tisochrysis_lutea.AAC.6